MKSLVAIIMGSETDYKIMSKAVSVLKEYKVKSHVEVVSAHRTPEKMFEFAKNAKKNGFQVIIAGAGGAAHLPGMVASLTELPVIGVPIEVTKLKGLDALLSIVQMPKGIPVATVALDNSENAALLALRILGLQNEGISKALVQHREQQKNKVLKMNRKIKSRK